MNRIGLTAVIWKGALDTFSFNFLLKKVMLIEKYNEWLASKMNAVDGFCKQINTIRHSIHLMVLCADLIIFGHPNNE